MFLWQLFPTFIIIIIIKLISIWILPIGAVLIIRLLIRIIIRDKVIWMLIMTEASSLVEEEVPVVQVPLPDLTAPSFWEERRSNNSNNNI